MTVKGAITYCNRCGFKVFRKANTELSTLSYYPVTTYEELPEGWKEYGDKHLCSECAKAWDRATTHKEEKIECL